MSTPSDRPKSSEGSKPPGRPKSSGDTKASRNLGASSRTAIYITTELLAAIAAQAKTEQTSNSGLISAVFSFLLLSEAGQKLLSLATHERHTLTQQLTEILELLLLSQVGQQLQQDALEHRVPVAQELQQRLTQVQEALPSQALAHLASAAYRTPDQLIAELVHLLLSEPIGQRLQDNIILNRRTFGQEVERNLILFREQIPTDEIINLAQATQRTPDEMLIRLVLLGLEEYKKRGLAEQE